MRHLIILTAIAVAVAVIPFATTDRFLLDLVIVIMIFATLATGWNIAGGFTGLFSLGHGALFATGAYGSALLYRDTALPMLLAIAVAIAGGVLLALIYGALAARLRGHYFALATLTVGMTFFLLLQNLGSVTGGDEGVSLPVTPSPVNLIFASKVPYVYLALGLYVVVAAAALLIHQGRLGHRMRAVREDEITARAVGVRVLRTRLAALAASGAISAAAGSLYACYTLYVTPANTAAADVALQPALMAIVGGMTSIFGPLVGAVVVVGLDQYVIGAVGAAVPGLADLIYGTLLIVCIIALPGGISGGVRWLAALWRRRDRRQVAGADAAVIEWDTGVPEDRTGVGQTGIGLAELSDVRAAAPAEPVLDARPAGAAIDSHSLAALELANISVRRGGLGILDMVSFRVLMGRVTSLIGPNGAGKTSALGVISGFLRADSGSVHYSTSSATTGTAAPDISTTDVTAASPTELTQRGIARTFQQARGFAELTVRENLVTAALVHRPLAQAERRATDLIDELDLAASAHSIITELPTGMSRRVELARALATEPKLLLLDEILAGLDGEDVIEMMRLVAGLPKRGITVLMVEHHLEAVMRLSDHIVVLDGGRVIAAGTPAEITAEPAVRTAYLGGELTYA